MISALRATRHIPILLLCAGALASGAGAEVQRFVIGNQARPWEDWGTLESMDARTRPGWIQPRQTTNDVNILHELYANGQLFPGEKPPANSGYRPGEDARIWSLNLPIAQNTNLLRVADGLQDTVAFGYFDRLSSNAGVSIIVDLGIPFPVSQVSFYPLSFGRHVSLFMRGYQLFANDGDPDNVDERGQPVFSLLSEVPSNVDVVVRDSRFPPQHIRYIKLRATAPESFELDQLEIRGEGYVRRAVFTSSVIDAGDIANFGRVLWSGVEDPGSRVTVQTRIRRHSDADWTAWSPPYERSGQPVFTDGPGRFSQLRVILDTNVPSAGGRVDSVGLEFSTPVMARRVTGQITPRQEVDLGAEQRFTYRLSAAIEAGDIGFDTVELETPSWAFLRQVRIAGRTLPESAYAVQSDKNSLSVRLLDPADRIASDADLLELVFDTSLLIYGTVFSGRVAASWQAGLLPQRIEEQRAGDLAVQGSEKSLGKVLANITVLPAVFTPNGDGINDRTRIQFRISQVIGGAPLKVQVYDLSGRLVANLVKTFATSDSFRLEWDGRDLAGRLVAAGLYVFQIKLEGDEATFARVGVVGVAY